MVNAIANLPNCQNRARICQQIVANAKIGDKFPFPRGPFLRRQESQLIKGGNAAMNERRWRVVE